MAAQSRAVSQSNARFSPTLSTPIPEPRAPNSASEAPPVVHPIRSVYRHASPQLHYRACATARPMHNKTCVFKTARAGERGRYSIAHARRCTPVVYYATCGVFVRASSTLGSLPGLSAVFHVLVIVPFDQNTWRLFPSLSSSCWGPHLLG